MHVINRLGGPSGKIFAREVSEPARGRGLFMRPEANNIYYSDDGVCQFGHHSGHLVNGEIRVSYE